MPVVRLYVSLYIPSVSDNPSPIDTVPEDVSLFNSPILLPSYLYDMILFRPPVPCVFILVI